MKETLIPWGSSWWEEIVARQPHTAAGQPVIRFRVLCCLSWPYWWQRQATYQWISNELKLWTKAGRSCFWQCLLCRLNSKELLNAEKKAKDEMQRRHTMAVAPGFEGTIFEAAQDHESWRVGRANGKIALEIKKIHLFMFCITFRPGRKRQAVSRLNTSRVD